jgi:SAM-dependent methyltransferase
VAEWLKALDSKSSIRVKSVSRVRIPPLPPFYNFSVFEGCCLALKYATYFAEKNRCKNIKIIKGDIFEMPFKSEEFDFVWNIGVIEHYDLKEIDLIFQEMIRVCKRNGVVAVGMPNF